MTINTIKLAQKSQTQQLLQMYRACGKEMLERGFDNWGTIYPPLEVIEQDIKNKSLFVLMEDDLILGAVALDQNQPAVYQEVNWAYEADNIMAIHRLAVAINHQKKGYAKELMYFAEKYAKKQGCSLIRFDAYSINKTLLNFYKKLGYQITKEAISLGPEFSHLFNCFEKKIANE